jgi:hypothetical protein
MGGAVSSIAKVVTAPANLVGSALGKVPVVGPILGPAASIAMGGNPFTAIGGGLFNAATGGFGGGGGGGGGSSAGTTPTTPGAGGTTTPTFAAPGFNYGANTYTYGNKPYDASKYFVEGNKGIYNLLPQLGGLYGDTSVQQRAGAPSANLYNDILTNIRMNQDTLAEQNFQKNFGLQTYNPNMATPTTLNKDFTAPKYIQADIQNALGEYYPGGKGSGTVPVNYADFGFGADDTVTKLAQYAKTQKNPFFVPYSSTDVRPDTTGPQPIMPVSSMPAPAPTSYKPATETSSYQAPVAAPNRAPAPPPATPGGTFKPVTIRTGGLASLRRK